jgi:hypothetical protein
MYQGYLFLCKSKSINSCIKNKKLSCSEKQIDVAKEIQEGSLIFLLNYESNTLTGPFTASEEFATGLEPGTWSTTLDYHSLSGNININWETLHELKDATIKITFLQNIENCRLTHFQISQLLEILKSSPEYTKQI